MALQLKLGWTEKQLREDNTIMRLQQIGIFLEAQAAAERIREHAAKAPPPLVDKPTVRRGGTGGR